MAKSLSLGPVMLDVAGIVLVAEEREKLHHPLVGGVILFARNFQSVSQLIELTQTIHGLRNPPLLIAVDHEGGRVQRFKEGFTILPPMQELGKIWKTHPQKSKQWAHEIGYVLATELRACGVDFSFTPVLDLDYGESEIIGNRSFHRDPDITSELAHHLIIGLREGGMPSVGKHFPGHGYVSADSHTELPVDNRNFADIELEDLIPFRRLIEYGLTAIMPAHVVYPKVDPYPAGFSKVWLQDILRNQLRFEGVIFSDDLNMEGAMGSGDMAQRTEAALTVGCDIALICNNPAGANQVLDQLVWDMPAVSLARLARMHGHAHPDSWSMLRERNRYVAAIRGISAIGVVDGDLPLDV